MSNEVYLYDEIGPRRWGLIDAKAVVDALADIGRTKDVVIRFNSPGGSVFEAKGIVEAVRRHQGQVTGIVDGIAASCASWILQACGVRQMAEGSHQMVHGPWTITAGNKVAHREAGDKLEMFETSIRDDYAVHWRGSDAQLAEALESEETWYTAEDAVEIGLADAVNDAPAIAACLPAGMWSKVPGSIVVGEAPGAIRQQIAARRLSGDLATRRQWFDVRAGKLGLTGRN